MSVIIERSDDLLGVDYPIVGWHRGFAVALLLAGGGLQLMEFLLEPAFDSSAERVQWWAHHSTQLQLSQALGLLAVPCLLGGFAYTYRLVRDHSRRLAAIAIAMLVCAMVGLALIHGVELAARWTVEAGRPDAAIAVLDADSPGLSGIVGFVMFLPTAILGQVLLTVAMWRSRYVPRFVVLFLIGFTVLDFALGLGVLSHASSLLTDVLISWAVLTRYQRSGPKAASVGAD